MVGRRHLGTTPARRDESGAAMVEFALILPILLALVFGILSYGWMLSYRQGMSQAAAEGARAIAVAPSGLPATGANSLKGRALSAVNRSLTSYGVSCSDGGQLLHGTRSVGTCTVPASASSCPAPNPGGARCATVSVVHDYRANPLIPSFPGLGVTLPSQLRYAATVEVN